MADTRKAAEVAERWPGWKVFSSRDAKTRVATRTGNLKNPDDGIWSATLLADDWEDLELQLKVQSQHDAMRTYEVQA
jgi:hypothetical protein